MIFRRQRTRPRTINVPVDLSGADDGPVRLAVRELMADGMIVVADKETTLRLLGNASPGDDIAGRAPRSDVRLMTPLATGDRKGIHATCRPVSAEAESGGMTRVRLRFESLDGSFVRNGKLDVESLLGPGSLDLQFQRIVEQLNLTLPAQPDRVMVVTGAGPGDGASTLAWWMAVRFAASTRNRVLLIRADMRWNDGFGHAPGLTEVLGDTALVGEATRPTGLSNMSVMEAGAALGDQLTFLPDQAIQAALTVLRQRFNILIFDAAPILDSPFALTLARNTDGAFLVVEAGRTDRDGINEALERLRTAGARTLGLIVNRDAGP